MLRMDCQIKDDVPGLRSAYTLQLRQIRESLQLILFGGDTGKACCRLNDVWTAFLENGHECEIVWEHRKISGTEPESRSNCASVSRENKVFIFGGWNSAGTQSLSSLFCLDLEGDSWTQLKLQGKSIPAVGQPGMIALTDTKSLIIFGGWNGVSRSNELYHIDLSKQEVSSLDSEAGEKPQARADHTCSLWRYCDDGVWKDLLVVFGGSTDYGTTNDVWLYDFRWKKWTEAFCGGSGPSPRSSHASSIYQEILIVLGGQNQGEVFSDCYMLDLKHLVWHQVEIPELGPLCRHSIVTFAGQIWSYGGFDGENTLDATMRIDLTEPLKALKPQKEDLKSHLESEIHLPQPRQEDKEDTANNLLRKSWLSSITASMSSLYQWSGAQVVRKSENSVSEAKSKVSSKSAVKTEAFNIFPNSQVKVFAGHLRPEASMTFSTKDGLEDHENASLPLTKNDLPTEQRDFEGWRLVKAMHTAALAKDRDMYIDPASGYSVFTSRYLERRPCCGNKCRHCPYKHVNVKKEETSW